MPSLSTAVIERCNDLFNYNPQINLNEDTCNTFTGEEKELMGFAHGFRVIATSTELAIKNLSDAALSRFTVIYTTSYTPDERNLLIEVLYKDYPKEFDDFLKKYKDNFFHDLPFQYVIKILNILKLLDSKKKRKERKDNHRNLCLAIHLSLYYQMKNKAKKKKFKTIINDIYQNFYNINVDKKNEEVVDIVPFEIRDNELHSNWSNLSIISSEINEEELETNLAFIKPFNKLLEHIFLSIAIHYPLIIEGGTGKGRKTSIKYIAKVLGYDIIYFNISNNTTVEDLFCKKMPIEKEGKINFIDIRSRLLDGIDANSKREKNCIIILDNLQNANSNVLESLIPVFDIKSKSILVNGEEIIKSTYNIIGIIDSSMESKEAESFLPEAIKYSVILYKNSKYEKREYCKQVIYKMFGDEANEDNEYNIDYYLDAFIKLNDYANKKKIKEIFTFNDFKKFLFFIKKSRTEESDPKTEIFGIKTITQLLLVYKFSSKDEIDSANEILKNSRVSDFWPIFSYLSDEDDDIEIDQFQIAPDEKGKNLCYPITEIMKKQERKKLLLKVHSLSPDQRRGIIFLMLSVLSDIPCIIKGKTASGKTHLIRFFCELLGRKPLIIDGFIAFIDITIDIIILPTAIVTEMIEFHISGSITPLNK